MSQTRRPSNQNRPRVSRPGPGGLRFGMFAVCVTRDSDPGLNKGKAKSLYHLLITYADVSSRNTAQGYPYRSALADALDCTKDTVDNATKYLEHEIGLIKVVRRKVEGQPDQNDANEYQVFDQWLIHGCDPTPDTPPQLVARYGPTIPGFDVDAWIAKHAPSFDLAGWRAAYEETLRTQEAKREEQRRKEAQRRKPKKRGGSGTHSATPGGTHSATGGGMSAALSRAGSPEPPSQDDDAPSGRSPAEPRRAYTGSKGSTDGGFAAPAKDSPAPSPEDSKNRGRNRVPRLTPEERKQMKAILELLPSDLLAALGDVIPTTVGRSMVESLAAGMDRERTPQQLVAHRLMPRWQRYWAPRFYAGELTPEVNGKKRKPFGPLLQMLKDTAECRNLTCEDRHDFILDDECRNCAMRKVDQAADRERERREAQEDTDRQAHWGEAQAAAAEADTNSAGLGEASVPSQRESIVLDTRPARRECAEDSCALSLPEDWDDELCKKCRTKADRADQAYREQQAAAGRYEAAEAAFTSVGPAPF